MKIKIKILRGDRGKWYCNTDNVGKEFGVREYYDYGANRFELEGGYWVDKDDCVITELPESFCVKRCDDNNRDDWNKYLQWLNKQKNYPIPMFGGVDRYKYYGVNGENLHSDYLYPFGTEIHIDDMIKHIDFYSEPMVIESKEEFDMTTPEGRLDYAKRNYPIGTKYLPIDNQGNLGRYHETLSESISNPRWFNPLGDYIGIECGVGYIYANNKWAEIIKEEFDMTTNEGRLAYAKRNYPVGTKYKSIVSGQELIVGDYDGHLHEQPENIWLIYYNGKWAEIIDEVKEETKMETNLLELIRLFPELPTDYAKKLVQKALEVKEGNLINLVNFIGSADTPTPFYEIITGSKSELKANYVWRKIYDFKNNIMETQKLSRAGLKEIHSVACSNWKAVLERYGANSPLEDYIELTQEQVNNMFKACTNEQLPIVSKYLKQDDGSIDVTKFKVSGAGFCDGNFYIIRDSEWGEYKKQSFLLSQRYDWEIKTDNVGQLCLIPTKKK